MWHRYSACHNCSSAPTIGADLNCAPRFLISQALNPKAPSRKSAQARRASGSLDALADLVDHDLSDLLACQGIGLRRPRRHHVYLSLSWSGTFRIPGHWNFVFSFQIFFSLAALDRFLAVCFRCGIQLPRSAIRSGWKRTRRTVAPRRPPVGPCHSIDCPSDRPMRAAPTCVSTETRPASESSSPG